MLLVLCNHVILVKTACQNVQTYSLWFVKVMSQKALITFGSSCCYLLFNTSPKEPCSLQARDCEGSVPGSSLKKHQYGIFTLLYARWMLLGCERVHSLTLCRIKKVKSDRSNITDGGKKKKKRKICVLITTCNPACRDSGKRYPSKSNSMGKWTFWSSWHESVMIADNIETFFFGNFATFFLMQEFLSTYLDSSCSTPVWMLFGEKSKWVGMYWWWFELRHLNIWMKL